MPGLLDVWGSRELQATILALSQMDRTLARRIFKTTRQALVPAWREELAVRASRHSLTSTVLLRGARADVSNYGIKLRAAQSTKKMRGGASPRDIGHAVEFGAAYRAGVVTAKSSKGKQYSYTRQLNTQFRPRKKGGHAAYPAALSLAPRFASLWVQTAVKTLHDAIERKL